NSCHKKQTVSENDIFYGVTFPANLNFYPFDTHKVTVPINLSPFIGAETRNDHDVVYGATCKPGESLSTCFPERLDGTTFAIGVTSDTGIRYFFDNGLALYAGFRMQFIKGFQPYLAWGPIFNVSYRF